MAEYGKHYSVLGKELLEMFKKNTEVTESNNIGDLTFGAGGHTFSFLREIDESYLYCFDQDSDAYKNGQEKINEYKFDDRITFINKNFREFGNSIDKDTKFSAILLDIGVSSHQFDTAERGFSFRFDAPLDMRMNQNSNLTAADILNEYSQAELEEILYKYGEEKFAKNIVKNILKRREEKKLETTKEMEELCFHSYPKNMRHGKIHPATKTFQALRIAVNEELDVLSEVIPQIIPHLDINGILAIITFHSLEDRIVKHAYKGLMKGEIPVEIVTKKPIIPSDEEISENSRSRSAKLRVLRRVSEWTSKNKYAKKRGQDGR